jgi:hypothetical protein
VTPTRIARIEIRIRCTFFIPPRCQRARRARRRASQLIQGHHRAVMPLDHVRRVCVIVSCLVGRASRPSGGADRDRTDDPRLAKPMLSQLSYSPVEQSHRAVGAARFELATPRLSSVCSNQLSYAPSRSSVCRRQDTMSVQRPGMLRSPIAENRVAGRSGLTASPKCETCR